MPSGVVKFFDASRGFGFITPHDGREDIFVHISAVEAAGMTAIEEGDVLEFDVENQGGRFTATELDLIERADPHHKSARPGRADRTGRPSASGAGQGAPSRGRVKWYDPGKGFGFIQPDQGGEDVFVHVSAVERAGLPPLAPGQALSFYVERNPRSGKASAVQLSLAED